jgi:hypothetical protein
MGCDAMQIQYQCGLQDYLEAHYAHYRRSVAFYVIAGCVIGSAGIFGAYQLLTEGYPHGYPLLAIVAFWAFLRFVYRPLWFQAGFPQTSEFCATADGTR